MFRRVAAAALPGGNRRGKGSRLTGAIGHPERHPDPLALIGMAVDLTALWLSRLGLAIAIAVADFALSRQAHGRGCTLREVNGSAEEHLARLGRQPEQLKGQVGHAGHGSLGPAAWQ